MKVLVIGSEGNIGVELVKHFKKIGHDVFECDIKAGWRKNYWQADINNPIDLLNLFENSKPDVVYLLAALVSRVTCEQAPGLAIQTNLGGLQNVIEYCKLYESKLIYFSTSEVYGNIGGILKEYETIPQPNNRYGLSKYLGEKLVEYEVINHKLKAATVRPFMFYHENETRGDHRSAMIRFIEHLSKRERIEIHRGSERSWLHLDDGVIILERVMHQAEYGIFNIGSPEHASIESLASLIAKKLNVKLADYADIIDLPSRMTLIKRPDLTRMLDILGHKPTIHLEEGVNRVISGFKF